MNARACRNRAAIKDPGALEIPYRGLGLITLAGTTHDTSLSYTATCGQAGVAILHQSNRVCGGSAVHYQAGTTCHVAMAVISRPPFRVHQMNNTWRAHHRRAWPHSISPRNQELPCKTPM